MLFLFFICVALLQLILYVLLDIKNIRYGRRYVLGVLMFAYLVFLPPVTAPREPPPDGVACGMLVVAHYLAFWIFGGGLTLFIHLLYSFVALIVRPGERKPAALDSSGPEA